MKSILEQQVEIQIELANLQSSLDSYLEAILRSVDTALRNSGVPEEKIFEYKIIIATALTNYGNHCIKMGSLVTTYEYETDKILNSNKLTFFEKIFFSIKNLFKRGKSNKTDM